MTPLALFLVGPPGVGKTTFARELMSGLAAPETVFLQQTPKWTVAEGAFAAAGHYNGGTYDGADTVPYAGASAALDSLESSLASWKPRLVLFDGDRFSHDSALQRVRSLLDTRCVLFTLDADGLTARRAARGSKQSVSWMTGRATKATRFFDKFDEQRRLRLDASQPTPQLVACVQRWLAP